jgi:hypothetical protein
VEDICYSDSAIHKLKVAENALKRELVKSQRQELSSSAESQPVNRSLWACADARSDLLKYGLKARAAVLRAELQSSLYEHLLEEGASALAGLRLALSGRAVSTATLQVHPLPLVAACEVP